MTMTKQKLSRNLSLSQHANDAVNKVTTNPTATLLFAHSPIAKCASGWKSLKSYATIMIYPQHNANDFEETRSPILKSRTKLQKIQIHPRFSVTHCIHQVWNPWEVGEVLLQIFPFWYYLNSCLMYIPFLTYDVFMVSYRKPCVLPTCHLSYVQSIFLPSWFPTGNHMHYILYYAWDPHDHHAYVPCTTL